MCLRQRMLPWFPDFSERAMQLVQTRFYRGVLRITIRETHLRHLLVLAPEKRRAAQKAALQSFLRCRNASAGLGFR